MTMHSPAPWPCDQPPDAAAFTPRRIILPEPGIPPRPILHVSHDAADHAWQFPSQV